MSGQKLKDLVALRDSIRPGSPLSEVQWLQLHGILDTIAEGYDVRKNFDIRAKPGAPRTTRGLQNWLVLHFLALRADDPTVDDKVHRGVVAQAWGVADNSVRKLVSNREDELAGAFRGTTVENILAAVLILQPEYKKLTRNPP